jgi:DNA phosphorothioation-dependent restriction protein DptH
VINETFSYFFDNGLRKSFLSLKEKNKNVSDLIQFEQDLAAVGIFDVNELEQDPSGVLSSLISSEKHPPAWWSNLDTRVWAELLESDATQTDGKLKHCVHQAFDLNSPGLPSVVRDRVAFSVELPEEETDIDIKVERSNGNAPYVELGSLWVDKNSDNPFVDADIPRHQKQLRYRLSADGYENTVFKVIVLDFYGPGAVIDARAIKKNKLFAEKRKSKRDDPEMVSEIHFVSMGYHRLDIYYGSHLSSPQNFTGHDVDAENSKTSPAIATQGLGHAIVEIETDEECHYEFELAGTDHGLKFRIDFTADDSPPEGVASEFERLVLLNVLNNSKNYVSARPEVRPSRRVSLESFMVSNPSSYRPLVLGPDFLNFAGDPWSGSEVLSLLPLPHNLWSATWFDDVPTAYISARKKLLNIIKAQNPEQGDIFSAFELCDNGSGVLSAAALDYLSAYEDWLRADYNAAIWADVLVILEKQPIGNVLESRPTVTLLSPLHPIKLSWQINAQSRLNKSYFAKKPCPVASELTPHHFPDCLSLACSNSQGIFEGQISVSMQNSNPYWSVLWSLSDLRKLRENSQSASVLRSLDLMVDGFSKGFKEAQVKRAINEVVKLKPAVNSFALNVAGQQSSASFNNGVLEWVSENLGAESKTDNWTAVGGRALNVFDARGKDSFPEQSALATASEQSGGQLNWYASDVSRTRAHLGIITQLGSTTEDSAQTSLRSGTDASGLIKRRVRQMQPSNRSFLIESFVGRSPQSTDKTSLDSHLLSTVHVVESQCIGKAEGLSFSPDINMLRQMVETASYTAISSSNIDAACFFNMGSRAYLWDYELPSFGKIAGGAEGFFLLASQSQALIESVKSGLKQLDSSADYSDDMVASLLDEIPKRGMPTLKKLTSGGSAALGELGMLAALKLLQFDVADHTSGIIPVSDNGKAINLLIPIDTFQEQLGALRSCLFDKEGERPDLLIAHISLDSIGKPSAICLTPVEIKARSGKLSAGERGKYLTQAKYFASFLEKLSSAGEEHSLWGVAWRDLVCRMIDYGFRIYSQGGLDGDNLNWSSIHQDTIHSISCNECEITVDKLGRLVVIDSSEKSNTFDDDSDEFLETFVLSKQDAIHLLSGVAPQWLGRISESIDMWGVRAHSSSDEDQNNNAGIHDPDTIENDSNSNQTTDAAENAENSRTEISEQNDEGISFVVGESIGEFIDEELKFQPGNTNLTQMNVGVVGDLGTGKTQLIKALISQLYESASMNRGQHPNILIFDYKRDYSDPTFVSSVNARVVEPFDIPLNIFDTSNASNTRTAWLDRVKFFNDVLRKIFGNVGPVQQANVKDAAKAAYASANTFGRRDPTLKEVFEEYKERIGGKFDAPYSIMDNLVDGMHFTEDQDQVIPFSEFLKGVVVVDLSKAGADDETKNMLVAVFLNLFYEHMLTIEKQPFLGKKGDRRFVDTMLLVDEADNIMKYEFPVLKQILLQGREFGVGVLLASQYLSHFKTSNENYAEPLNSWFIHKVPKIRPQELDAIGLAGVGNDLTNKIKQLELHQCLYKTWGVDGKFMRGKPFYEIVSCLNDD